MTTTTPSGNLNGIDVDALRQKVDEIAKDPAKGKATFRANTRWTGRLGAESTFDHWSLGGQRIPVSFTLRTDEPKELLGDNAAPNPQMILMAAMNTCILNTYVAAASIMGVTLDSLEVESQGELDLRGFLGIDDSVDAGYHRIDITFRVRGDGTREQFDKMLEIVKKQSPNYYNMANAIELRSKVEVQ